MVARVIDRVARVEQAPERLRELVPAGVDERDVVKAGVALRGGVAPALSNVLRPMWWW